MTGENGFGRTRGFDALDESINTTRLRNDFAGLRRTRRGRPPGWQFVLPTDVFLINCTSCIEQSDVEIYSVWAGGKIGRQYTARCHFAFPCAFFQGFERLRRDRLKRAGLRPEATADVLSAAECRAVHRQFAQGLEDYHLPLRVRSACHITLLSFSVASIGQKRR
ncbi:MAG: hypothetical protein FJ167_00025 [Gammaproteobacteria bacterium]|nr:hypothetical protein [Gammaproteobacteria bacterium]